MKVYEVMKIIKKQYEDVVETALFDTLQKAKRQKAIWITDEEFWLDDLQSLIDNEQDDTASITNEDNYFYAYDYYDSLKITITEKEII